MCSHGSVCFQIVCQACSSNKHGLDYMKNQPARVCDHCFRELQKQGKENVHKTVLSPCSLLSSCVPHHYSCVQMPSSASVWRAISSSDDRSPNTFLWSKLGSEFAIHLFILSFWGNLCYITFHLWQDRSVHWSSCNLPWPPLSEFACTSILCNLYASRLHFYHWSCWDSWNSGWGGDPVLSHKPCSEFWPKITV